MLWAFLGLGWSFAFHKAVELGCALACVVFEELGGHSRHSFILYCHACHIHSLLWGGLSWMKMSL